MSSSSQDSLAKLASQLKDEKAKNTTLERRLKNSNARFKALRNETEVLDDRLNACNSSLRETKQTLRKNSFVLVGLLGALGYLLWYTGQLSQELEMIKKQQATTTESPAK